MSATLINREPHESAHFFPPVVQQSHPIFRHILARIGYILLIVFIFTIYPILAMVYIIWSHLYVFCCNDRYNLATFWPRHLLARHRYALVRRQTECEIFIWQSVLLPVKRKRRLSDPADPVTVSNSSLFLTKFPLELRLRVYRNYFAAIVLIEMHQMQTPNYKQG